MEKITTAVQEAFEDAGFEVSEVSRNRDRIRVAVLDPEASGGQLRDLTYDAVDESDIMGLNVTTESGEEQEPVTVVSFRYRG